MNTIHSIYSCLICIGAAFCLSSCGMFTTKYVPYYNYDAQAYAFHHQDSRPYEPKEWELFSDIFDNKDSHIDYWNKQIAIMERERRWSRHEPRYIKKCAKWLQAFYTDLYTYGDSLQKFSEKYAVNLDSVLRPTLTAAYEKANPGEEGLDWSLFGFNVKDSTELRRVKVSYSKNHWFQVQLPGKDTLKLKVRIEDYRPKVLINGLLNPQKDIIMTPLDRMKIQALVRLYRDLGECTNKDFTDRYAITFTPEILDTLRYGDKDGYNWDILKIGKEKFTDIRDEDVTCLGDDWFFIAPRRRKVGFIVLQVKVKGVKFKVTGFKVPDQPS